MKQEQFTQVDGSNNNVYRLNAHVYNGEGRIVQRREFSRVGNSGTWTQAPSGQPQPNYRFVYANGESLAELSEALGTSRTTTPESELQASGIAGTGGPYAAGGGVVVA